MWTEQNLKLTLDITTHCNAKCPQCSRTDPDGLDKVDWLPLVHVTTDKFKCLLTYTDLNLVSHIDMCPTWGDPIMNPDVLEILSYIFECNPNISVSIDTNGSMRDEDWWWNLGARFRKFMLKIRFAIDGCTEEMHQMYRRNTSLSKVLSNLQSYTLANGMASSKSVLFKHNIDYLEDIKKIAMLHGSFNHTHTISNRFYTKDINKFKFTYKEKEEYLESAKLLGSNVTSLEEYRKSIERKKYKVTCEWGKLNKLMVNFDGQVHPCCYIGNQYPLKSGWQDHPTFNKYKQRELELNLYHNSLLNIMNDVWYQKQLEESFNDPCVQCIKSCGKMEN